MEQASILEGYSEYGPHPEQQQKKSMLFGTKQEPAGTPFSPQVADQLRDMSRRLRILEERYANQRKNVQVLEHNMLSDQKKLQNQFHSEQNEIDDLKKQIYEMKQKLDMLAAELSDTAKRGDVLILEKYINLWEPLNFVTRNEVEKLIITLIELKQGKPKQQGGQ